MYLLIHSTSFDARFQPQIRLVQEVRFFLIWFKCFSRCPLMLISSNSYFLYLGLMMHLVILLHSTGLNAEYERVLDAGGC